MAITKDISNDGEDIRANDKNGIPLFSSRSPSGLSDSTSNIDVQIEEENSGESLRNKFNYHYKKWKEETRFSSSAHDICSHNSYQKIISMGDEVLVYIFDNLRANKDDPDLWFHALSEITDEDPVDQEHKGHTKKMAEDWLDWAEENNYLT